MPRTIELPRVLDTSTTARLDVTEARTRTEVRRGNWQRPCRGIVMTFAGEPSRDDWAAVGIALGGPGCAVTAWDALRSAGLARRVRPHPLVVVLSPHCANRVVGGVRLRRTARPFGVWLPPDDADRLPLTPAVHVPRAVADASLEYPDADTVRAMVADAVQRRRCGVEELTGELASGPRNRSAHLRRALDEVALGIRSVAEAHAVARLIRGGVPAFEMNVPIVDDRGRLVFVVDFLWRGLRAVLEIDSREFHLGESEWKATMARHNALTAAGFTVTHYAPSAVRRAGWADAVHRWLAARAHELGVAMPAARGAVAPGAVGPQPVIVPGLRKIA